MQRQSWENQEKSGNQKPGCSMEGKGLLHTLSWLRVFPSSFNLPATGKLDSLGGAAVLVPTPGGGSDACAPSPCPAPSGKGEKHREASQQEQEHLGLPLRHPCPFPSSEINPRAPTPTTARAQGVSSVPKQGIPQLQGFQTRNGIRWRPAPGKHHSL